MIQPKLKHGLEKVALGSKEAEYQATALSSISLSFELLIPLLKMARYLVTRAVLEASMAWNDRNTK